MILFIAYFLLLGTALALLLFTVREALVSLWVDPYDLQLSNVTKRRYAQLIRRSRILLQREELAF